MSHTHCPSIRFLDFPPNRSFELSDNFIEFLSVKLGRLKVPGKAETMRHIATVYGGKINYIGCHCWETGIGHTTKCIYVRVI